MPVEMAYTLGNKCAKNLCKRLVLLQLIIENVVTCFFWNTVYFNPLTGTLKLQSNGPLDSSWYTSPPSPFLAVPNATAHPSTTSVFILFDVSLFLL